jgi:hypothetical protein
MKTNEKPLQLIILMEEWIPMLRKNPYHVFVYTEQSEIYTTNLDEIITDTIENIKNDSLVTPYVFDPYKQYFDKISKKEPAKSFLVLVSDKILEEFLEAWINERGIDEIAILKF